MPPLVESPDRNLLGKIGAFDEGDGPADRRWAGLSELRFDD